MTTRTKQHLTGIGSITFGIAIILIASLALLGEWQFGAYSIVVVCAAITGFWGGVYAWGR